MSAADPATRTERDSFGPIDVPATAWWGAQTERSRRHFAIGEQRMPLALIRAMALIKGAAAEVNQALGRLPADKAQAIAAAARQIVTTDCADQFPLSVWQTGSGTQSHMNVNEVLAHLATRALGPGALVHPNDDVNLGQSSNDVFPSAMHVAALLAVRPLQAALTGLRAQLQARMLAWHDLVKTGRTHLQDAVPITLGQEFSGYDAQLGLAQTALEQALPAVCRLAIGGTAVGSGLNTHPGFGAQVAARLAAQLGEPFGVADNLFAALAGHEALVGLHAALRMLAIALIKIGGDLRLMGSGPRAGLGELHLPENEPGSSIMPGKVNPTQIEALLMVCTQVMGHDVAIGLAASQGQFELNTCKPLIAHDVLDSLRLLRDAIDSFTTHCVAGLQVDEARIDAVLQRSLMLVTALAPRIGYDQAGRIARHASQHGLSLREAALALGAVSAADFDRWVDVRQMLGPG
ncbi:MAG: hypothetical protein RJA44_642 [Pseudomonadota bacterium]|jgi:fumarate hydratase class II